MNSVMLLVKSRVESIAYGQVVKMSIGTWISPK